MKNKKANKLAIKPNNTNNKPTKARRQRNQFTPDPLLDKLSSILGGWKRLK